LKKLILLLSLLVISCISSAQDKPWSLGAFYQFHDKSTSVVAFKQFDTLPNVLGISWLDVDLSAFAGTGESSTPVGGSATLPLRIADRLTLSIGVGVSKNINSLDSFFKDFRDFRLGLAASLTYQVKF